MPGDRPATRSTPGPGRRTVRRDHVLALLKDVDRRHQPLGEARLDELEQRLVRLELRGDQRELLALFQRVTGEQPKMWGESIVGFGSYHYKYDSGREGDWLRTGFSPRKANISIHLMGAYCTPEAQDEQQRLLEKLGPHKTGASCLYITRLARVDMDVLEQLIANNWTLMNERYPL